MAAKKSTFKKSSAKKTDDKTPKFKLNIIETLAAIDTDSKEVWDEYSDEEKNAVPFYILNRWMSNVSNKDRQIVEHYVLATNEIFNKHFFSLVSHPKLLWQLACSCTYDGTIQRHNWLPAKGRIVNKKEKILRELFPDMKFDDIITLAKITTDEQIEEHCTNIGWDKQAIDNLKL